MARKTDQHRRRSTINRAPAEAYLDTSAFIAFLDASDSYHSTFKRLFASPPPLLTSALVLAEGHGWFLRRYDRMRAAQFLAFLDSLPNLTVRAMDSVELTKIRPILARFRDQDLTLADGHGLAIMEDNRTASCWSTDRHLTLLGVKLAIFED